MTESERQNAIRCIEKWIKKEPFLQTYKTCLEALKDYPCYVVNEQGEGIALKNVSIDKTLQLLDVLGGKSVCISQKEYARLRKYRKKAKRFKRLFLELKFLCKKKGISWDDLKDTKF